MLNEYITSALALLRGRVPRQVVIQLTDACNASCPQCGMRASAKFKRSRLDKIKVREMIEHAARQKVQAISFTGGEPFLNEEDLFELIRFAKINGIRFTRTGTNGFPFLNPTAADFDARVSLFSDKLNWSGVDNFWISLDSADVGVHESSRGLPGVVTGIEKALPILEERGIYPTVNIGLNRILGGNLPERHLNQEEAYEFYTRGLRRLFNRAIDLRFTILNCCYPMSSQEESFERDASVYQATGDSAMISFRKEELRGLYLALFDLIPEYRKQIRIFTPRSALYSLMAEQDAVGSCARGCRGGSDYLFVSSTNGHAYPCGYRGEDDLGEFTAIDFRKLPHQDNCTACEWECFRDPTELFGPLSEITSKPLWLAGHIFKQPEFYKLWLEDIRYAIATQFFNGRSAPDFVNMTKASKSNESAKSSLSRLRYQ